MFQVAPVWSRSTGTIRRSPLPSHTGSFPRCIRCGAANPIIRSEHLPSKSNHIEVRPVLVLEELVA